MKLKLDENFGRRGIDFLNDAGHDVATVAGQQMSGAADKEVIQTCYSESRCLGTLDLDFSNPFRFRPVDYSGIAVIRLSGRASYTELLAAITTFAKALETESIVAKLWIVKPHASASIVQRVNHSRVTAPVLCCSSVLS